MTRPEKKSVLGYESKSDIVNKGLNQKDKKIIEVAVKKFVREYGETLRLLGKLNNKKEDKNEKD